MRLGTRKNRKIILQNHVFYCFLERFYYKISRSLYFYVKKAHIGSIPGIEEFLTHFVSEDAIGEDGYLIDKGLIPLPEDELLRYENDAKSLANMRY